MLGLAFLAAFAFVQLIRKHHHSFELRNFRLLGLGQIY
jgi:hypothetical protein